MSEGHQTSISRCILSCKTIYTPVIRTVLVYTYKASMIESVNIPLVLLPRQVI